MLHPGQATQAGLGEEKKDQTDDPRDNLNFPFPLAEERQCHASFPMSHHYLASQAAQTRKGTAELIMPIKSKPPGADGVSLCLSLPIPRGSAQSAYTSALVAAGQPQILLANGSHGCGDSSYK